MPPILLLILLVALRLPAARAQDPQEGPSDPPGAPETSARPSQAVQFLSYTSIQVNVAIDGTNIVGDAANEPSLAVDPNQPNHMVITWRQFDTVTSSFREAGYAYTYDGGRAWTFPGAIEEGAYRSDPVVECDADGNFYYLGLYFTPPPDRSHSCYLNRSTDGGVTWSGPVYAWGGDKPWMAIDRSDGIGRGNIYSSWNPAYSSTPDGFFTRSTDGGMSFETPIPMPEAPLFGTMIVGRDGTLYIAGKKSGSTGDEYVFLRSENAKDPAATPTFTTTTFSMGGILVSGSAYPHCPNPDGYMGQVWLGIDESGGPRDGHLYALGSLDPEGFPGAPDDPMDVFFVRSQDGGFTWSAPVKVNDDPFGNGAWQWFGTMSVAPNGRIDAIWNDTRNTFTPEYSELFYSYSMDGGVTWAPNQQLSPIWSSYLGFPTQNKIGDYYDMASDRVGAHVVYAATFNAGQDIYYLRIGDYDCNDNGIGDQDDIQAGTSLDADLNGIPDECEGAPVAVLDPIPSPVAAMSVRCLPNPFNPTTTITFELPSPTRLTLAVYDVAGRWVETLFDGVEEAGPHSLRWNAAEHASGVYFVRLQAGGDARVAKAVVLK